MERLTRREFLKRSGAVIGALLMGKPLLSDQRDKRLTQVAQAYFQFLKDIAKGRSFAFVFGRAIGKQFPTILSRLKTVNEERRKAWLIERIKEKSKELEALPSKLIQRALLTSTEKELKALLKEVKAAYVDGISTLAIFLALYLSKEGLIKRYENSAKQLNDFMRFNISPERQLSLRQGDDIKLEAFIKLETRYLVYRAAIYAHNLLYSGKAPR